MGPAGVRRIPPKGSCRVPSALDPASGLAGEPPDTRPPTPRTPPRPPAFLGPRTPTRPRGVSPRLTPGPAPRPRRPAPSPTGPGAGQPGGAPTSGGLHPGLPRPALQCPRGLPPAASTRPRTPRPSVREAAAVAAAAGESPAAAAAGAAATARGVAAQRGAFWDSESLARPAPRRPRAPDYKSRQATGWSAVEARWRAAGRAGTPSPPS